MNGADIKSLEHPTLKVLHITTGPDFVWEWNVDPRRLHEEKLVCRSRSRQTDRQRPMAIFFVRDFWEPRVDVLHCLWTTARTTRNSWKHNIINTFRLGVRPSFWFFEHVYFFQTTSWCQKPQQLPAVFLSLQVPYEILNKKFRQAQKNIDREVSHVTSAATELDNCLQKSCTVGEVNGVLNGMVEKLSLLKRKVGFLSIFLWQFAFEQHSSRLLVNSASQIEPTKKYSYRNPKTNSFHSSKCSGVDYISPCFLQRCVLNKAIVLGLVTTKEILGWNSQVEQVKFNQQKAKMTCRLTRALERRWTQRRAASEGWSIWRSWTACPPPRPLSGRKSALTACWSSTSFVQDTTTQPFDSPDILTLRSDIFCESSCASFFDKMLLFSKITRKIPKWRIFTTSALSSGSVRTFTLCEQIRTFIGNKNIQKAIDQFMLQKLPMTLPFHLVFAGLDQHWLVPGFQRDWGVLREEGDNKVPRLVPWK